ncbi:MAG: hypothetical protein JXP73_04995 [Deltaproteobacteria bacterium]|nr:hypothetical protein [Deltaproteobacteria bacterium]
MLPGSALLVAFLSPLVLGAAASSSPAPITSVRLDVRAAPGCTSRGDLVTRVTSRSSRIRFVDDGAFVAQATFAAPRPGSVTAEITLTAANRKPSRRRVVARSCAEAADAIALIIAVTLDPTLPRNAVARPSDDQDTAAESEAAWQTPSQSAEDMASPFDSAPAPGPKPAVKPVRQAVATPAKAATALAKPSAIAPAKAATPAPLETAAPESPATSAPPRHVLSAHVAGQLLFGPAPSVMPGVAVQIMAGMDREGLWSPAIFLGATHVWRAGLRETGGTASFTLDAGSLDACPLRARLSFLEARPCASVVVGRLVAGGDDTDDPATVSRPFASAGGAAILTAGLGAIVELHLRLAAGVTLVRDSFEFSPIVFHRAGLFTTSASLGAGARWP